MTVVDKLLFTCNACQYRARIPGHYAGRSIHCPGCKTIQPVAAIEEPGAPRAAPVARLDTPALGQEVLSTGSSAPTPGSGKIVFACSACSYKGRLAAAYDGKTIRCPGCQTAQIVKGTPAPAPIVASMAADETAFRNGDGDKIRFGCSACGYRARIPGKYADKPIHCPQCKQIQVAKAETDLEEATGRTVSLNRVTPAAVKEPRLAMTNVGVQFRCAVCGFESRISPSCAGDAIYCPSCRAPQKVEWGDPAASAGAAASSGAALDSARPVADAPAAPEAAPAAGLDDLPLPGFDLQSAPVAEPAAMADAQPEPSQDGSDLFAAVPPVAPPPIATVSKKGNRRIVSVSDQVPAAGRNPTSTPAPAPKSPASAPVAAAKAPITFATGPAPSAPVDEPEAAPTAASSGSSTSTPAVPRARRQIAATKVADETAAPAAAADREHAHHGGPAAKTSKLPLLVMLVLVLGLIGVSAWLFVELSDLKQRQSATESEAKSARDEAARFSRELEAQIAAAAKARDEAAAAQREAEAAHLAAEAARQELETLKAAAPAPAPEAAVPGATGPAAPAPAPAADPAAVRDL